MPPSPVLDYASPAPPRPIDRLRFAAWVILALLILGGNLLLIHSSQRMDVRTIVLGWPIVGAGVVAMAILLRSTPASAIRLSHRTSALIILLGAAGLQLAALTRFAPFLSDDMLRYRSDGRMWTSGASPYSLTPTEANSGEWYPEFDVPHPHLATIYPPIAQVWFWTVEHTSRVIPVERLPLDASLIGPADEHGYFSTSENAFAYRLGAATLALLGTAILLACLVADDRSPWYAALFAWNPLTVIECAGQGHIDMLGVFFLLLAVVSGMRGRFLWAAIALAVSAGVKPHAALLAPVLIGLAWRASPSSDAPGEGAWNHRGGISTATVFAIALVVVYAPLLFVPANWHGWRQTMDVYAMSWEANGSIYELITTPFRDGDGRALAHAKQIARLVAGVAVFLVMYVCLRNRRPLADSAYWLTLIPLLLAPVVYPWYLLWGLAMVPLLLRSGGWTMLAWAATSGISYQLWNEPTWRLSWPWALAEYVPVYMALAWELGRRKRTG